MKFIKNHKLLFLVFLLSLLIRLIKLNTFPLGFHIDEAKVAWESFSILKTLRDDHGNLFALYYNSFGDYRPTGIFYTVIPFLILFGKNIFAVRFASSFFGALTVFPIYFISETITKKKKIALLSALLLAIIPWSITTSRATSEVVISAFLILTSLALLPKKTKISFLLLALSFFLYHSARVLGPVLMFVWITYLYSKDITLPIKKILLGFYLTLLLSLALFLSPTGLARYNQVKLASPSLRSAILNYGAYFDPNFLIGDIAKPFRYITANTGIVSLPIFLCFIFGIYRIAKTNKHKILFVLFILGPIPASLTLEDSPNLHRAFFMLPFLIIIAGVGLNYLLENHKLFFKLILFCIFWSFVSFCFSYFNNKNNFAYEYRDPNISEVVNFIKLNQNNYDKIYVTNDPDSPYPWFYFFGKYDPIKVNNALQKQVAGIWQYENIIWYNSRCPAGDAFNETKSGKIMVIDNGMCFVGFERSHPEAKIIKEFIYEGKVNYRVWEYAPTKP